MTEINAGSRNICRPVRWVSLDLFYRLSSSLVRPWDRSSVSGMDQQLSEWQLSKPIIIFGITTDIGWKVWIKHGCKTNPSLTILTDGSSVGAWHLRTGLVRFLGWPLSLSTLSLNHLRIQWMTYFEMLHMHLQQHTIRYKSNQTIMFKSIWRIKSFANFAVCLTISVWNCASSSSWAD